MDRFIQNASMVSVFVVGGLLTFLLAGFTRAFAVRAATGKWPHETKEGMAVWKQLP